MPDLALDLRNLRYAIAAAQHGSLRKAAAALNISQSTLTRRVQLLEHRIGFRIFDRSAGGVRLTAAGQLFLEEASVGAQQLGQAIELATSIQQGERGDLQVGVLLPLAGGRLHLALKEFHQRYPHIRVCLHEGSQQQDLARVMTGELDISFMAGTPKLSGQEALQLWTESIYVALPENHKLTEREALDWDDIASETFVVSQHGAGPEIRDYLVRKLSAPSFRPKIDVHDVSRHSLLNIVAMGYGISLASASIASGMSEGVTFLPIRGDLEQLAWSAVWSPTNSNPALRYLLRLVKNIASGWLSHAGANGAGAALMIAAGFHALMDPSFCGLAQILDPFV